jgi:hypothetical protein
MKIQHYKMQLVNKILEIEDPELLRTLQKIIKLHEQTKEPSLPFPPDVPDRKGTDQDLHDLQKDINEVFGP